MSKKESNILGGLVREARQHDAAERSRIAAERAAQQWKPTALVLVETAISCTNCGHTTYCSSGVLVRYVRKRKGRRPEIHETDTPHSLEPFEDLPRQITHRHTTSRACRHCFMKGNTYKMLAAPPDIGLRHEGNSEANALDIDESLIDSEAEED